MTAPNDDHTLNACLARVIGVEIKQGGKDVQQWWAYGRGDVVYGEWVKWNPLHDANQMELVEAWLRENGYEFGSAWSKDDGYYTAHVLLDPNPSGDPKVLYRTGRDIDKKRAFALAIWELEQSQKGGKGE